MKKVLLTLVCVSVSLMVIGFGIFAAAGFVLPNDNYFSGRYYDSPVTVEQKADAALCRNISIIAVNDSLTVQPYDGSEIDLKYDEQYRNQWDYSFKGSTLSLQPKQQNWFFQMAQGFEWFKHGNMNGHITLLVPKNSSLGYRISQINGQGNISEISADSFSISSVNAQESLENVTFRDNPDFKGVNGSYSLKGCAAHTLNLTGMVNISSFELADSKVDNVQAGNFVNSRMTISGALNPADYNVHYQLTNGSVRFNGADYSGTGSIGIAGAAHTVQFRGVNSSLEIEFT